MPVSSEFRALWKTLSDEQKRRVRAYEQTAGVNLDEATLMDAMQLAKKGQLKGFDISAEDELFSIPIPVRGVEKARFTKKDLQNVFESLPVLALAMAGGIAGQSPAVTTRLPGVLGRLLSTRPMLGGITGGVAGGTTGEALTMAAGMQEYDPVVLALSVPLNLAGELIGFGIGAGARGLFSLPRRSKGILRNFSDYVANLVKLRGKGSEFLALARAKGLAVPHPQPVLDLPRVSFTKGYGGLTEGTSRTMATRMFTSGDWQQIRGSILRSLKDLRDGLVTYAKEQLGPKLNKYFEVEIPQRIFKVAAELPKEAGIAVRNVIFGQFDESGKLMKNGFLQRFNQTSSEKYEALSKAIGTEKIRPQNFEAEILELAEREGLEEPIAKEAYDPLIKRAFRLYEEALAKGSTFDSLKELRSDIFKRLNRKVARETGMEAELFTLYSALSKDLHEGATRLGYGQAFQEAGSFFKQGMTLLESNVLKRIYREQNPAKLLGVILKESEDVRRLASVMPLDDLQRLKAAWLRDKVHTSQFIGPERDALVQRQIPLSPDSFNAVRFEETFQKLERSSPDLVQTLFTPKERALLTQELVTGKNLAKEAELIGDLLSNVDNQGQILPETMLPALNRHIDPVFLENHTTPYQFGGGQAAIDPAPWTGDPLSKLGLIEFRDGVAALQHLDDQIIRTGAVAEPGFLSNIYATLYKGLIPENPYGTTRFTGPIEPEGILDLLRGLINRPRVPEAGAGAALPEPFRALLREENP